ncbi:MAG: hypothetical protein AAB509_02705 [Patescibacteria group bacterium]
MRRIVINIFDETIFFFNEDKNTPLCCSQMSHEACTGVIMFRLVSSSHIGMFCSICGRIPDPNYIPGRINTIAKLEQWCLVNIKSKKRASEEIQNIVNQHAVYDGVLNEDSSLSSKGD